MPALRTEITEIATGLGMIGMRDLEDALSHPSSVVVNVDEARWQKLQDAYAGGLEAYHFSAAWKNGRAFLEASDGLRGRIPISIEWKGPHNPPGFDFLPTDLRVDHVFLVSCKYLSKVLANSSPGNLFDRRLSDRSGRVEDRSWYNLVAAGPYYDFYSALRERVSHDLPTRPNELAAADIETIRSACTGSWPSELRQPWSDFSYEVARGSAERWKVGLSTKSRQEEMLWRLLRLSAAPYFVLGLSSEGPMRLRIGTPWDWRQHFSMADFEVWPERAGQPKVNWRGTVVNKTHGGYEEVNGHVQVRWSHGRFSSVEAKVYLDTRHEDVPGYFALE